jgi:hypothetical protein
MIFPFSFRYHCEQFPHQLQPLPWWSLSYLWKETCQVAGSGESNQAFWDYVSAGMLDIACVYFINSWMQHISEKLQGQWNPQDPEQMQKSKFLGQFRCKRRNYLL